MLQNVTCDALNSPMVLNSRTRNSWPHLTAAHLCDTFNRRSCRALRVLPCKP